MKHLTEEELIAQALNEGAGAVAGPIPGPIEDHLKACTECADSYLVLLTDLAAMRSMAPPERDQSYGERVWESLAPSLAAYKPRRWGWWPRRDWPSAGPNPKWWRGLAYAGAGALLMVGAFFAGSQWEHWKQGPPTASVEHKAPQTKQPIVVVVLDDHLDHAQCVEGWRVTERGARLAGAVVARKFLVPPRVHAGGRQPQAGQPGSRLPLAGQDCWRRAGGA